jgi:SAM-dependent methyltransferase
MISDERLFPATMMPDPDWWHALWPDPEKIVKDLGIKPGMVVIDLGCGDGYFTAAICRKVAPGLVVGVDLDSAMLEQAKAACDGLPCCESVQGDAMDLSRLATRQADFVLIANTFHGVPDKIGLAREVAAVLKPEGRFGIINWHAIPREKTRIMGQPRGPRTEMRMTPGQVSAVVEPAGFVLDQLIEFPPYHYGAVFAKTAD